jgi:hypothetical protein
VHVVLPAPKVKAECSGRSKVDRLSAKKVCYLAVPACKEKDRATSNSFDMSSTPHHTGEVYGAT